MWFKQYTKVNLMMVTIAHCTPLKPSELLNDIVVVLNITHTTMKTIVQMTVQVALCADTLACSARAFTFLSADPSYKCFF